MEEIENLEINEGIETNITISNFKNLVGKKVKVLANGASIPTGIVSIVLTHNVNGVTIEDYNSVLYLTEIKVISFSKTEIETKITELEQLIKIEQDKLIFINENKLNEFDINQYKIFQTLKTLEENNISNIEKSKLIAKLITK